MSNLLSASDSLATLYENHVFYPPPPSKQLSRDTSTDDLNQPYQIQIETSHHVSVKALEAQISALKQIQDYQERISDPTLLLTHWRRKVFDLIVQKKLSDVESKERIENLEKQVLDLTCKCEQQKKRDEEYLQNTKRFYIGKEHLLKLELKDSNTELELLKKENVALKAYLTSSSQKMESFNSNLMKLMDKLQKDSTILHQRLQFNQTRVDFALKLKNNQNQEFLKTKMEIKRLENECQMLQNQLNHTLPHETHHKITKGQQSLDVYQRLYSLSQSLLQEEEE